MFRIVLVFALTLAIYQSNAQIRSNEEYARTSNIDPKADVNKKKNQTDPRRMRYIVMNEGDGILYGNPCWLEATRKMRFEYVVQREGVPGSMRPNRRRWENTKTFMNLIILRSPFWKVILNNRIKDCRQKSGDMVG